MFGTLMRDTMMRLRVLVERKELSAFSREMNIPETTLRKLLNGSMSNPTIGTLDRIIESLEKWESTNGIERATVFTSRA